MSFNNFSIDASLSQDNENLQASSKINPEHAQEWLDSGVHPDLISLNVQSVTGPDVFELWYPNPERLNGGRLAANDLRKYQRLEYTAGWLVDGVDPQTGLPTGWARYKSTEGEILDKETGKPIKYLSQQGVESRLIFLRVSEPIWQRVSERLGVPMPETYIVNEVTGECPGFWPWVLANNVNIEPAEGEKKAGSLLTQGYAAVSIPGIWNGRRNPKDFEGKPKGEPFLVPDLAIFDTAGRQITFIFDHDATPEKRATTLHAAVETGKCFKNAEVKIALLPGPQKGVDDFIVAGGDVHEVLAAAKPLSSFSLEKGEPDPEEYANYEAWESQEERVGEEFEKERNRQWAEAQPDRTRGEWARLSTLGLDRTLAKLTKEVCERYLNIDPDHDFLPGINVWASPMGTGKTHNMAKIVERFPEGNVFSYRNSLLQNTATRIPKVDYIHDLGSNESGKADRLLKSHSNWTALCVDSILKVRTKDVIVLEEVSKLIDHLLRGATVKRDRAAILKAFQKHIEAAKYIFMLDADTSDLDVRYIKSLAPNKPIHIIKNVFQPWQWPVNFFVGAVDGDKLKPNDRTLIEKLIIDAPAGDGIPLIVSDSQTFCEATHRLLTEIYGDEGLRIDSQTKVDDADRVNAFLSNPNKWIEENKPLWLILSPTAESSLDITTNYFTDVYAVFFGVISCYSMRQMLGRYRVPVTRWVFCRTNSMSDNGASRSPFAKTTLKHLHQYDNATLNQIALDKYLKEDLLAENDGSIFTQLKALCGIADFESETWKDPHLKAWSEYQARDNYQKINSRQTLREMLEHDGHLVQNVMGKTHDTTGHKRAREEILAERSVKIATAKDISIEEAREIQRNMAATTDERYAAKKAVLKDRCPGVEITAEFVEWAEFGRRGILNQLQNYFMWRNPGLSETVDRQRWRRALENGDFLADIRTQSLELKTINDLQLGNLLDGTERGKDDPEVLAFHQRALARAKQVKTAFGITVKADSDINYLLGRMLGKVAIKYTGKQYRGEDGERHRLYSAVLPEKDENCQAVLAAYAIRYADLLEKTAPVADVSQTAQVEKYTLTEQSVTKPEILPDIDVEPIDITVKGLPPVEPDQPIEQPAMPPDLPKLNSTVAWLNAGIKWVTVRRFLSNKLALIENLAGKLIEVSLDELQWVEG